MFAAVIFSAFNLRNVYSDIFIDIFICHCPLGKKLYHWFMFPNTSIQGLQL